MVGIASAATHAYRDRGVVMFRNQNIKPGFLDDSDILYIAEDYEASFKNKRLRSGDLLTARTGYPGTTSIVPSKYEGAQTFTTLITRPRRDALDSVYLCCFINSEAGQRYFDQNQIGGGQKNVNAGSLKNLLVPIPPTKAEQEAIAEALSDADALIESLEQLLAKKRQIKQGTMQELLTGQKRLPGFAGEWETKRLGDIATLKARIGWQGLTTAEYRETGDFYLVTGTEFNNGYIDWNNCFYVEELRYRQDRYIQLRLHDVLVTKDGTIGKVALIDRLPLQATLNSGVFVIRPIDDAFHPEFFYYLLCSEQFTGFLAQLSAGSTINHLYQKDFVGFIFKMPASIEEQTAIATALSDMDAGLAALEAKLAKARNLKQGMMQELLTGRIRLV
jgi:type I restriction enzyme S subunit